MNITLKRREYLQDGVFGDFYDENHVHIAVTLEHAYGTSTVYTPKLPVGFYTCVRGTHSLHNGIHFETFEVTNVPGHTNILIHAGNFNKDSEGCILVGQSEVHSNGAEMITNSKLTFAKFMQLQSGVSNFILNVI